MGEGYGTSTTPMHEKPEGENAFIRLAQRPRIMLVLLAGWALLGVLTEAFTNSDFFLNAGNRELDGAIAARALSWQGIPLAVLYLYCARDPVKYQRVFWLALIEQVAAFASAMYHWLVTEDFSGESVFVPLVGSAALATLVFVHLFQPRQPEAPAPARE